MADVHLNAQSAAIAGMVIDLCHELDLDIVAEGVEHEAQLEFLKRRGCHVIQGFLFSPPVTEDNLIEVLGRRQGTSTDAASA
jgi:EAL domain-containing protein (putative c-di-GMP-specific phosphodiesterase class I)